MSVSANRRSFERTAKSRMAVTGGTATHCHATATQNSPVNIGYCHVLPRGCHYCHFCSGYRGWQFGSSGRRKDEDQLSANVESLNRTVRRHSDTFTRVTGADGIARIALVERRTS